MHVYFLVKAYLDIKTNITINKKITIICTYLYNSYLLYPIITIRKKRGCER